MEPAQVTDFTTYVEARWPALIRAAILLGHTRPAAEDLVQDTLIRCYSRWSQVLRAANRDAYVYRIMFNLDRTHRRRRWRSERPSGTLHDRSEEGGIGAHTSELSEEVAAAVTRLTIKHREVVVLRYFFDLEEKQMAKILRIPVGTVKSRLHRAQATLFNELGLGK
jgi:RNA polymerase sigma-70 factor (sigma-E family)